MSSLREMRAATEFALLGLPKRFGPSIVIVVGIAGVVGVLLSMLAMTSTLSKTITDSGHADRALVMRTNAGSETASSLSRSDVLAIGAAPGVARTKQGGALVSAEVLLVTPMVSRTDGKRAEAVVRGLTPNGLELRREIRLTRGRMFGSGVHELLAGRTAQLQFQDLAIGSKVSIRNVQWEIVGTFESSGDRRESELLADADTLLSTYQRNTFNAATVALSSAQAFQDFETAVGADPTLQVNAQRESDYYHRQSEGLSDVSSFVKYVVGTIMAIGATFGALTTMYAAVSLRANEIATLRAIGFRSRAILASVIAEALALAIMGALIGAVLVWILFHGRTMGAAVGDGQVVAQLVVDAKLVLTGIAWAVAIGLLGGLFPALQAARQPVVAALRES